MDLFSDGLVTITFGDGPLGFRVGESEEGFPIISGFTEKDDSTYFPIYVGVFSNPNSVVCEMCANWLSNPLCEQ